MDDDELERRLRRDPTLDPPHRPGAFRDRLVADVVGAAGARRHEGRAGGPLALAATLLVVVALVAGRIGGPPITPAAPAAPGGSMSTLPEAALQAFLVDWAHRGGLAQRATLAVIGSKGETWTGVSTRPGEPVLDPLATYRVGGISQILIVSAVMSLDECGRGVGLGARCPVSVLDPPFGIDDTLGRWVPNWPNGDTITVRQLMDGTSGLAPVTSGISDLLARAAADPSADWTEAGVLERARTLTPAFAPGAGFALTDTADLLLDVVIARVTRRPSLFWIGTSATSHMGLISTKLPQEPPGDLVPGTLSDGRRIADLPPAVLASVGNARGVSASAFDLAQFANAAWATTWIHDASTIALVTDLDPANDWGLGVGGFCPCPVGRPTVVGLTGHAAGWSGIVAKDLVGRWSIALLVDADRGDSELEAALDEVLAQGR